MRSRWRAPTPRGSASTCDWLQADLLDGSAPASSTRCSRNPPYVAERERAALAPEILRHEPRGGAVRGRGRARCDPRACSSQLAAARAACSSSRSRSAPGRRGPVAELLRAAGFAGGRVHARPCGYRARGEASAAREPREQPRGDEPDADADDASACATAWRAAASPCSRATPSTGSAATPTTRRPRSACTSSRGARASASGGGHVLRARAGAAALPELRAAERAALQRAAARPGDAAAREPLGRRSARPAGSDPATLGLRVPWLPEQLRALAAIAEPVMQSSANLSGRPDARTLAEVPAEPARGSRRSCSTAARCRERPRRSSTCASTSRAARWYVLREGALAADGGARAAARTAR